jgi:hypothetical protein
VGNEVEKVRKVAVAGDGHGGMHPKHALHYRLVGAMAGRFQEVKARCLHRSRGRTCFQRYSYKFPDDVFPIHGSFQDSQGFNRRHGGQRSHKGDAGDKDTHSTERV